MRILFYRAAVLVMAAALGACGGQAAGGAFGKYLTANNLTLPNAIDYDDFDEACRRRGLLKTADYLESVGVEIQGGGSARYLRRLDILRACGEECTPKEGLGEILTDLAVYKISDR